MSYRSHSHHPNPGQSADHWAYEYPERPSPRRPSRRPPPSRATAGRTHSRRSAPQRLVDRLHAGAWAPSGPSWAGRVLDRGRQSGGDGRLVGGDRHLFRISRRCPEASDRPAGGDAIRLRRPDRRIACAGRPHHQPPIARPGAIRAEARSAGAQAIHAGATRGDARLAARSHHHRLDPEARARQRRRTRLGRSPPRSTTP